jgi:hypothetical protein
MIVISSGGAAIDGGAGDEGMPQSKIACSPPTTAMAIGRNHTG